MTKNCLFCSNKFKTRNTKRKYCSHPCYSNSRRGQKTFNDFSGSKNPNWRGGKRFDKDGYVIIHSPYHPFADSDGYVREHRLIVEKSIKRFLTNKEIVHHLNSNKSDNRLENLQLMNKKEHDRINAIERRKNGFLIENFSPTVKKSQTQKKG